MLTTDIFLSVFLGTLAIILGLLIPLFLIPLKNDVADIRDGVKPIKQIDEEMRRLGLHEYLKSLAKPEAHQSLPPEKARRKEELLYRGRACGLDPNELRNLNNSLTKRQRMILLLA
jgi:hypothetical protein